MKKILFSCAMMSILAVTSAFAEGTSYVVTKSYVDKGLTILNNKVTHAQTDVDNLSGVVGSTGTGLVGRVEQLENTMNNLPDLSGIRNQTVGIADAWGADTTQSINLFPAANNGD